MPTEPTGPFGPTGSSGPDESTGHVPVLVERVVELVVPALQRPGAVLVDATVGLGGHTEAVLDRCPQARVVGLDRDPTALDLAGRRLARFGDRVRLVETVYDAVDDVVAEHGRRASASPTGPACADAVLFDLGVSSIQLDRTERGFSYAHDAPLDMRMGGAPAELAARVPTGAAAPAGGADGPTAADLLNTLSATELARVLRSYGEERFARRIADAVVRARSDEPFTTSARLVELVRNAVPAATRRTGGNPAKRTFQALRIAVNDELAVLRRALPAAIDVTCLHGRVVVLAYHSLEDRIVKSELATRARADVPDDFPVVPEGRGPSLRLLTRGAEKATPDEVAGNPRASSVRLRAAERIRVAA